MTAHTYPVDRVEDSLVEKKLPLSHRIIARKYLKTPLGTAAGDSRFCAKADGYSVLYAASDFATAFVETVVRDRFTRKERREIRWKEVAERAWAQLRTRPRQKLRLLDLRQDGCVKLGAPTDVVNARNHAAGRAFGRTIHAEHKTVDGFLYGSRLTGGDAYALFDRALFKLDAPDSGILSDHTELRDVLSQYDIRLMAT